MGAAAGYDDVNGAGSGVSDAAVSSGETGSTSGAVIEEGANADGINASENPSANDDLAMQSIDGFVTAIEEVEEPKGLATSILQSRIDALPTPEEFFAMTEGEMGRPRQHTHATAAPTFTPRYRQSQTSMRLCPKRSRHKWISAGWKH